jgi:multidrug efflux pump subunit AcrA (membrane-fusion protein)
LTGSPAASRRPSILWLAAIVVAAVAVAVLIRGTTPNPPAGSPTSSPPGQAVIFPERRDIRSVLVLDGVAVAATPVELAAPEAGTVATVVASGSDVAAGGSVASIETAAGRVEVPAPESGVVAAVLVRAGQALAAGDVIATVAPRRFEIVAPVEPAQQYRLFEPPTGIVATIERGPGPFDCPFVSIGADAEGGNPLEAPVLLRCRVPDDIRVFSGVIVRIGVTTGQATDVLALPVEAVAGLADVGFVTVVTSDGGHERRDVTLGLTDGVNVEILAGLTEADQVLSPPDLAGP